MSNRNSDPLYLIGCAIIILFFGSMIFKSFQEELPRVNTEAANNMKGIQKMFDNINPFKGN